MALDASPRTGRDAANRGASGSPLTDYSLLVLESELVDTKRRVDACANALPVLVAQVQQTLGLQQRPACLEIVHADSSTELVVDLWQLHAASRVPQHSPQVRVKVRLLPLPLPPETDDAQTGGSHGPRLTSRDDAAGAAYHRLQLMGEHDHPAGLDGSLELSPLSPSDPSSLAPTRSRRRPSMAALAVGKMRMVKVTTLPQWFDAPVFHLLDQDVSFWAVSFATLCGAIVGAVPLVVSRWCGVDADSQKGQGRLIAGLGAAQFWVAHVFILRSMRKVWRPLSRGGGALTEIAPLGTKVTLQVKRYLERMRAVSIVFSCAGILFFAPMIIGWGEIYTSLGGTDPDAIFHANRTELGFLGSHAVAFGPDGCFDVGTVRVLIRLFQLSYLGLMAMLCFGGKLRAPSSTRVTPGIPCPLHAVVGCRWGLGTI